MEEGDGGSMRGKDIPLSHSTIKSPCERNCTERTAHCKRTCSKWKVYEAQKQEEYKERERQSKINDAIFSSSNRLHTSLMNNGGAKLKHGRVGGTKH